MINLGFALCGSFCTFSKAVNALRELKDEGYCITPIMSGTAYATDTRFGKAKDFNREIEEITSHEIIHTIFQAEPIGPKKLLDILLVCPCTGNTLAKIANGVTDTAVTLAVKAHLRNERPVVLFVSTNDALGASAKNIGLLMNCRNIYFVPMKQDDFVNKPNSVVADFASISPALRNALEGKQTEPLLI